MQRVAAELRIEVPRSQGRITSEDHGNNSSVRSALASLCRDGMAKVVPAPIDAVRPGPRSEFYQITDLGRDVLKKTDELLNLIPVPSNPKRKEMA